MPGHLLVVPKRHVEKLSALQEDERRELFEKVIQFQEKILSKLASGCDIKQNYRPFQKQSNLKRYKTKLSTLSEAKQPKSKPSAYSSAAKRTRR